MKQICLVIACLSIITSTVVFSQSPNRARQAQSKRMKSLSEKFVGVTTNGTAKPGVFKIESTGVSTEPVRKAALAFLAGLNAEQRKQAVFPVDDIEWRKWDNRHRYERQGVGFDKMTEVQRKLAFDFMGSALSAKGLKKTQDIMKLNGTLAELTNRFDEYGEWLYWITIMGEPSADKPWGWQLDGHHVVLNYFVLGEQVVMSPVFMGSEPVEAKSGKFKGTIVMQDEEIKGLKLMQSLSPDQQKKATINSEKGGTNNLSAAFNDNLVLDYAGIKVSELSDDSKALFYECVAEYIGSLKADQAKVRMSEIRAHINETYFAWIGAAQADSVFYYRIQSPVILIEFDHQRPVALSRDRRPTKAHIHTVIRTPNGNDYGKDMLRQHYEQHHK